MEAKNRNQTKAKYLLGPREHALWVDTDHVVNALPIYDCDISQAFSIESAASATCDGGGGRAEPDRTATGVPFPYAVPLCDGALQDRGASAAGGRAGASDGVPSARWGREVSVGVRGRYRRAITATCRDFPPTTPDIFVGL